MKSFLTFLAVAALMFAAAPIQPKKTPPDPAFNRLYPNAEIVKFLRAYAEAYPEWMKLESIGKGSEGDDVWAVTITNPATGAAASKPAIYVDAATHANEIQGTEVCLYIINYALKNYGKLPRVTELLDRGTLYLVPMVNVDSRRKWFTEPATPNYPRTIPVKIDDDRDGRVDEDGYEDLNGDGEITMMRKRVPPGQGNMKLDPKDPRLLIPLEPGEKGEWIMLGLEGIDNDNDGQLNEDTLGYIDPNRTFAYGWMPRYVQPGAPDYPLQTAETRAVAQFLDRHPNIIAGQSFHNTGGLILRGPGSRTQRVYPASDTRAFDFLGKEGEKMLPHYRYGVTYVILYQAYGGTHDHLYGRLGAFAFTNELNSPKRLYNNPQGATPAEQMKFNDELTQGRQFADWKPYKHPQYGDVEIGGYKHDTGRPPEGFLLEEECHRNASFVFYHAHHMPKLEFGEPVVTNAGGNLWRVELPLRNDRALPSMAEIARQLKLHRADVATVTGAKVVASGTMRDPVVSRKVDYQLNRPERLMVPGVGGFANTTLFLLLEGSGEVTVEYDSVKAGKISRRVRLQ